MHILRCFLLLFIVAAPCTVRASLVFEFIGQGPMDEALAGAKLQSTDGRTELTTVNLFVPEYDSFGIRTGKVLSSLNGDQLRTTIFSNFNELGLNNPSITNPVYNSVNGYGTDDFYFNKDEGVTFEFDHDVIIRQIDFTFHRQNQSSRQIGVTTETGLNTSLVKLNNVDPFQDIVLAAGTDFTITMLNDMEGDRMAIKRIIAEFVAVPEPSSALLVMSLLLGSLRIRSRRP